MKRTLTFLLSDPGFDDDWRPAAEQSGCLAESQISPGTLFVRTTDTRGICVPGTFAFLLARLTRTVRLPNREPVLSKGALATEKRSERRTTSLPDNWHRSDFYFSASIADGP